MDDSNNIEKLKQDMQISQIIFSEKEIDETIKSFILAYLHGKIILNFPSADEIHTNLKKARIKTNKNSAYHDVLDMKVDLFTSIEICCGCKLSTSEELITAKGNLFRNIMLFKITDRLKGTFLEFQGDEKIKEFETKLDATNNLVSKLLRELTDKFKE